MTKPLAIILGLVLAFAWPQPGVAGQEGLVRVATSSSIDPARSGVYVWLKAYMDALHKAGIKTLLYPNSALGGEPDRTELVQLGLLQVNDTGTSEVANLAPLYRVTNLPFLFSDEAHFDRFFLQTDFLDRINAATAPLGLRVVDAAILGGMSGLFNTKKPIARIEDLKGLRLRAMERTDMTILAAWNVPSTQVAWEEVPNALETGIAEGYVNPPMVPVIFGHTRQIKFFSNLRMYPSSRTIVVSEAWYQGLSDRERQAVDNAIRHARQENRRWAAKMRAKELGILASRGVAVTEISLSDRQSFVARARAIYTRLVPTEMAEYAMTAAAEARKATE